jgi:2-haloalkanoic acid dehalogenase type II
LRARPTTPGDLKLVIFDLDNTLCDHRSSLLIRLDYAFRAVLPEADQRKKAVEESVRIADDGTAHFPELLTGLGISGTSDIDHTIQRYRSDRYRGLELFTDAISGIELASEYFQIAMITNGPTDIQQPKIDLLGIEDLFSFVLISESTGYWKPDPRIFELALERAGVSAHEAVYIGDSAEHDVAGAKAAGLRTVWMNRRGQEWSGNSPADHAARDMAGALAWLGISVDTRRA